MVAGAVCRSLFGEQPRRLFTEEGQGSEMCPCFASSSLWTVPGKALFPLPDFRAWLAQLTAAFFQGRLPAALETKLLVLPPDRRRAVPLSSRPAQSLTLGEVLGSTSGKQLAHGFSAGRDRGGL